jgi:hypothetical protein
VTVFGGFLQNDPELFVGFADAIAATHAKG